MTPTLILAVAAGGAIGSVARYVVGVGAAKLFGDHLPWGTLIINVSGSFLIGLFIALFAVDWQLPQPMRVFLVVGICGGYTTFSTFSLDSYKLIQSGEVVTAGTYIIGSVLLSVSALMTAVLIVRSLPNS